MQHSCSTQWFSMGETCTVLCWVLVLVQQKENGLGLPTGAYNLLGNEESPKNGVSWSDCGSGCLGRTWALGHSQQRDAIFWGTEGGAEVIDVKRKEQCCSQHAKAWAGGAWVWHI
jgi:hypothetical protein